MTLVSLYPVFTNPLGNPANTFILTDDIILTLTAEPVIVLDPDVVITVDLDDVTITLDADIDIEVD